MRPNKESRMRHQHGVHNILNFNFPSQVEDCKERFRPGEDGKHCVPFLEKVPAGQAWHAD